MRNPYSFLLLIYICLLPGFCFSQVDLNKELMAYYPFNGNANDASGNNNNPIFNNATLTTDYYGKSNSAYHFNGVDNYMQIPNSTSLNFSNIISICAWVRPTGFYTGPCYNNMLISKQIADYVDGNYSLRFSDAVTGCTSDANTNDEVFYGPDGGIGTQSAVQLDQWYNVVFTSDGITTKLYVNCKLVSSQPLTESSYTNGYDLFLGHLNDPTYPYWLNGDLDEVRIYNRALSADEVEAYSSVCTTVDPCNNWLKTVGIDPGVQIGDLDVSGNKITVEALINRTDTYRQDYYGGDVVSKHTDPTDVNYLLRPNRAEITTTTGWHGTPDVCFIDTNKTYHLAMVYDGKTLKFYRNGFLMSQTPCTGNLILNNWITRIGSTAAPSDLNPTDFHGYINEVRIWNVAKSQTELRTYQDKPLPNPSTQTGLLAYYTFDDLKNKQGNSQWDGTLLNNASINQPNPTCSTFNVDSCDIKQTNVVASFTSPDSTCVNTPINITNTSVGATTYYWSFCQADLNQIPNGDNLGNISSDFSLPVYSDIVSQNGNYYVFVTNNYPGSLTRLDFGNSLLNTPSAISLGNFGGILKNNAEGVQIVNTENHWYGILVGGSLVDGVTPQIIKLDFGSDITNTSPAATDWGNIGDMSYPHELYVFNEEGNWYGFTANYENNTITRFDFGQNFLNPPIGTNLGDFGTLNGPTGLSPIKDDTNWYLFVTNGIGNTITRLNFGNSLLNTPTAVSLGNLNGTMHECWDISIQKYCDQIIGFVVNGDDNYNNIVRLDFNNDLLSVPTATSLGNIGNLSFPHSFSKLFRVGSDLYNFIPNAHNNTITRLEFSGCTNSSIPNTTQATPPPIKYDSAGVYNINLSVDEGLPTQTTYCKQIVVINCDTICNLKAGFTHQQVTCDPKTIQFADTTSNADSIHWDFGNGQTDTAKNPVVKYADYGQYMVHLYAKTKIGCTDTATDTINVSIKKDSAIITRDTSICAGSSIQLSAIKGLSYCWSPAKTLSDSSIQNPVATPIATTTYYLNILVVNDQPVIRDSITVTIIPLPVVNAGNDTTVCGNNSAQLNASGATSYIWNPIKGLSDPNIANPVASAGNTTTYHVTGTDGNSCVNIDSVTVFVQPPPGLGLTPKNVTICNGDSALLTASGGDLYSWSPVKTVLNPSSAATEVFPSINTTYKVVITNIVCKVIDSFSTNVTVKSLPEITVSKSNDIDCINLEAQLMATGGMSFKWTPDKNITNTEIDNPIVNPPLNTWYYVNVKGENGCKNEDSILVISTINADAVVFDVPKAFTPNHDGLNDCFGVKYWGPADYFSIEIYDRWGYLVYHSNNISACWDGTINGKPQASGTYVYKISVSSKCTNNIIVHKKGTVVLIR